MNPQKFVPISFEEWAKSLGPNGTATTRGNYEAQILTDRRNWEKWHGEHNDHWHVVIDANDATPWYAQYVQGLRQGLETCEQSHEFHTGLHELNKNPDGIVFLTRFSLYPEIGQFAFDVPIIIQEHDTFSPFTMFVNSPFAIAPYTNVHQHLLICATTESMAAYIAHDLKPAHPVIATGFPYYNPKLDGFCKDLPLWDKRPKLILFPQRIDHDTQPLLCVFLTKQLQEQGWNVQWLAPEVNDHYPCERWQKHFNISIHRAAQEEFYQLARKARYAITTSMSGTMSIALYEAARLGCRPLVPTMGHRWPGMDPFQARWPILQPQTVLDMILGNRQVSMNTDWYDPTLYVRRIQEGVKQWNI